MRVHPIWHRPRGHRPPTARRHRPGTHPARLLAPAERVVLLDTEVARQLSLSLAETRALLRTGSIPARQVGGVWVTTQARLAAWVDALPPADPPGPDEHAQDDDTDGTTHP